MPEAFAIAGLSIFSAGAWNPSTGYGPTVLDYGVGMWFVMVLPLAVVFGLFGAPMAESLIRPWHDLSVAAIVHAMLAVRTTRTFLHTRLAVGATALTMMDMVIVRHLVRSEYVNPFLRITELPTLPQWSVIGLFLVLFVGGLATLGWMRKKTFGHASVVQARAAN